MEQEKEYITTKAKTTTTTPATGTDAREKKADDAPDKSGEELSLKEVIQEQVHEDEAPHSSKFSLAKILGGDLLSTAAVRRQVWLFLLIAFFLFVYTANRYSCQHAIIEIDKLQKELKDAKYKALSSNSQLTEISRQSNVLDALKNDKDSTLKIPDQPPYIIQVPE